MGDRLTDIISGIFLLLLGMYAAFIYQTTGCRVQELFENNVLARHVCIFCIVFFAIDFTKGDGCLEGDTPCVHASPLRSLWEAVVVYVAFLMFSRTYLPFSIAAFFLLGVLLFVNRFLNYETSLCKKCKNKNCGSCKGANNLGGVQTGLLVLTAIVILVGFCIYATQQFNEHFDEWSLISFIFGKRRCGYDLRKEGSKAT